MGLVFGIGDADSLGHILVGCGEVAAGGCQLGLVGVAVGGSGELADHIVDEFGIGE